MYKIQPNLWENGTALYYSLQLPDHRPLPGLSDVFTQSGVAVGAATYAIVFIQWFFVPFPWSSVAMIALIVIFVSDHTYEVVDRWLRELSAPVGDWFYDRYR